MGFGRIGLRERERREEMCVQNCVCIAKGFLFVNTKESFLFFFLNHIAFFFSFVRISKSKTSVIKTEPGRAKT